MLANNSLCQQKYFTEGFHTSMKYPIWVGLYVECRYNTKSFMAGRALPVFFQTFDNVGWFSLAISLLIY